jgi:hypothetical protein
MKKVYILGVVCNNNIRTDAFCGKLQKAATTRTLLWNADVTQLLLLGYSTGN